MQFTVFFSGFTLSWLDRRTYVLLVRCLPFSDACVLDADLVLLCENRC